MSYEKQKGNMMQEMAEVYRSAANFLDPEASYSGEGVPMVNFRIEFDILDSSLENKRFMDRSLTVEELFDEDFLDKIRSRNRQYAELVRSVGTGWGRSSVPESERNEAVQEMRDIAQKLDRDSKAFIYRTPNAVSENSNPIESFPEFREGAR